ncbi:MAG: DUF6786 family protein [Methylococcaceae bacterium]|nr:DUF6786 family protein [Prolixibacteraceae bacterium]
MKKNNQYRQGIGIASMMLLLLACSSPANKNSTMADKEKSAYAKGTYGYDVAYFEGKKIQTIELKDEQSKACILLLPQYQGRVMTSSANGNEGDSFGWTNYKLLDSGVVSKQFNPIGGEERFWMGPEGGPFSIYFAQGQEQVFPNWVVPPVLDTESYEIKNQDSKSVTFVKNTVLKNAAGTEFNIGIERKVSLLSKDTLSSLFKVAIPSDLDVVAYQSDNSITNLGENAWTKDKGLLSIWMLCMFNPSPTTTVFIPYKEEAQGVIVNDEYFGKVPADRLIADKGTIYFKIDGKHRSKIGLPPERAKGICGSFDSEKNILTLLWCSMPEQPAPYVNSKWGKQDDPFKGDVINSYNDGPVEDGSIMGPFYEIETSSPAALLQAKESLTHTQRVAHIQGDKEKLAKIVNELFGLDLNQIATKF